MWELLCLLLPLAALSGWYIGRQGARGEKKETRTGKLSADYYAGLNFLLNDQTDKALEAFIKMLSISPDTFETTLALGNFFRKRGEVSRAIQIHQTLVAHAQLSFTERNQAQLALAQDYMCAGVYDRAESLLLEINDDYDDQLRQRLRSLLAIYEKEKEWEKAIDVAHRLQFVSQKSLSKEIAHYYCELAEVAWSKGKVRQAFKHLKQGKLVDSHLARISLMRGKFEKKLGKIKRALNSFQQGYQQDPHYLPQVLPMMISCCEGLNAFEVLQPYFPTLDLKSYWAKLQQHQPVYRCQQCGFASRLNNWQCPSCHQWAVIKAIQHMEGE